ncbi:hypothetical protein PSI17_17150, partial [Xenorhabdus sp. IM139775]|nr:hypothetical protein [Xenorhabdus sp. IM139775]
SRIMMKKILIYLIFVLTSISQQAMAEYTIHHLRGNDGKDIIYYLIQRDKTPSEGLLVLIQGSDCKSVINNQPMIENFGIAFPENDILLVEKSGLDSTGRERERFLSLKCMLRNHN